MQQPSPDAFRLRLQPWMGVFQQGSFRCAGVVASLDRSRRAVVSLVEGSSLNRVGGRPWRKLACSGRGCRCRSSAAPVMGLRMMDRELYRSEADQTPNGLRYQDTGQRTNGSEITLDTRVGKP